MEIKDFPRKASRDATDRLLIQSADNAVWHVEAADFVQNISGGQLVQVASPPYAISSHPNGHPNWGGNMSMAFNYANFDSYWQTPDGGTGAWIGQSFPSPKAIKRIGFRTGYGAGYYDSQRVIRQFRIESSSNFTSWDSYGIWTIPQTPFMAFSVDLALPQNHQHWRVFIHQGSTAYVTGIGFLQMFE